MKKVKNEKINMEKFKDEGKAKEYKDKVKEKIQIIERENKTCQERWNEVVRITKDCAKETLGITRKMEKRKDNEEIQKLSVKQKELKIKIDSMKQKHLRQNLKRERNQLLNRIHRLIAEEEMKDINGKVDVIEKMKEDSYRIFKAVNIIKKQNIKTKLTN